MAKIRIGAFVPNDLQTRTLYKVFSDPVACAEVVSFLTTAKAQVSKEQVRSAQAYAVTDAQTARALALQLQGQEQVIDDLISLVTTVNK